MGRTPEEVARAGKLRQSKKTGLAPVARYLEFEQRGAAKGLPLLTLREVETILRYLSLELTSIEACLEPYRFALALRAIVRRSRLSQKAAAEKAKIDPTDFNKYCSGKKRPKTLKLVRRLASKLEATNEEERELLRAAGFAHRAIELKRPTEEGEVAVDRLLTELRKGVGPSRGSRPSAEGVKDRFNEGKILTGIGQIMSDSCHLVLGAVGETPQPTILVNVGDYFTKFLRSFNPDSPHKKVLGAIASALSSGCNVRCLTSLPATLDESVNQLIELFDLLGHSGDFRARGYSATDPERPLRGIQSFAGKTLLFFPRVRRDSQNRANYIIDREDSSSDGAYAQHFNYRYHEDGCRPLIKHFEHNLQEHVRLEAALLKAEEMAEGGRFLFKPRINSMMIPADDDCWEWERQYLINKYASPDTAETRQLLGRFRELKLQRMSNLQVRLSSRECKDICCRPIVEKLLKEDPETQGNPSMTIPQRIKVVKQLLQWLDNPHYDLALAGEKHFGDVSFEIALGDSVLLQIKGPPNDFHIQVFENRLVREAFEGRFSSIWDSLMTIDSTLTRDWLKSIKDDLENQRRRLKTR